VVLLALTPTGLQRQLDALSLFCDLRQLIVNLGKTKIMIFNGWKMTANLHFFFQGEEIEITSTYTCLGVRFSGPRFSLRLALHPWIAKGYGSLALLKRLISAPFLGHLIQDVSHGLSWTPLSDPLFFMAQRSRGLPYWRLIGPQWRESRPFFDASLNASKQFLIRSS
jgi:hypothetical protein